MKFARQDLRLAVALLVLVFLGLAVFLLTKKACRDTTCPPGREPVMVDRYGSPTPPVCVCAELPKPRSDR